MAKFNPAFKNVIGVEGGYVNHPADRGGPTNWGITQKTLANWRGRAVTALDVKNLTKGEAEDIYKQGYWDVVLLSDVDSQLLAEMIFDQAVNRGPRKAVENLQESFNRVSNHKLVVDGVMGSNTLTAINDGDELDIAAAFLKDAQLDYATIVANNSNQRVFIRGWINRTHKLMDLILDRVDLDSPKFSEDSQDFSWLEKLLEYLSSFFVKKDNDTTINKILKNRATLPKEGVQRALEFIGHAKNKNRLIFVNFRLHDKTPRLFDIDLKTGKSEPYLVSHGKKSDPDRDGYPTEFSNERGSNKSSLGAMLTGELYGKSVGGWSKFTHALKLHGLEVGTNDNVYDRAIVMHDANYVQNGGDSLGCLALRPQDASNLIPSLEGGVLVYCHY